MELNIGILIPYSGEFPGLKSALLKPLQAYALEHNYKITTAYIASGDFKTVERAVNKLCYDDDVDVIIGYVGYRVMVRLFDSIRKYKDKFFIHLTLGEIIPYSQKQLNPPENYRLVSFNTYKNQAVLGKWISENLMPKSCLMCSSLYDSGYSIMDSFRIGYHSEIARELHFTVLKNPPGSYDMSPLFEEIERVKPAHIHVVLCGRELDAFLNQFDSFINYSPSLSFAFPLEMKSYLSVHPSFEKTYTIVPDFVWQGLVDQTIGSPFQIIFMHLAAMGANQITKATELASQACIIINQNLVAKKTEQHEAIEPMVANALAQFEYSAAHMISSWENPYLCI